MVRISLVCCLMMFGILACKNYDSAMPAQTATDSLLNNPALTVAPAYARGAKLISSNDCITCHAVDQKMFGPSYQQIAARYKNNENLAQYLAQSVLKGNSGVFGTNAMTPHPNLPYNDIVEMTRYILSVNSNKKEQ